MATPTPELIAMYEQADLTVCCYSNFQEEVYNRLAGRGLLGALIVAGGFFEDYANPWHGSAIVDIYPTGTFEAPLHRYDKERQAEYEQAVIARFIYTTDGNYWFVDKFPRP